MLSKSVHLETGRCSPEFVKLVLSFKLSTGVLFN